MTITEDHRIKALEDRISKVEARLDRQNEDISDLKTNQAEINVYIKQILQSSDETRKEIQLLRQDLIETFREESKQGSDDVKSIFGRYGNFVEKVTYVLVGAVVAIITWFIKNGN